MNSAWPIFFHTLILETISRVTILVKFTNFIPPENFLCNVLAWPSLQSLAVKKKLFFVQILGGEKLLKSGEKWAVKNF